MPALLLVFLAASLAWRGVSLYSHPPVPVRVAHLRVAHLRAAPSD